MERREQGGIAPYGQACLSCYRSKCKCVSRPDGGCERCHRLKKQCYSSESVRKRNVQVNQSSSARIAQLEKKLDGFVSLLQSVALSSNPADSLHRALEEEGITVNQGQENQGEGHTIETQVPSSNTFSKPLEGTELGEDKAQSPEVELVSGGIASLNASTNGSAPVHWPSLGEAEAYITFFRSKMLRHFAFMNLPSNLTAPKLRKDRPMLFYAIIAVASVSTTEKRARGRELKSILAQEIVVESRSSIDLLQALLTYSAWGNDKFINKTNSLSSLMHLVISLVHDLSHEKEHPGDAQMLENLGWRHDSTGNETIMDPLERQRTILGCFLLISMVSSHFAQMDPLPWTLQMEEYLNMIESNKGCPTDFAFAMHIRLQQLAQKVNKARETDKDRLGIPPLPIFLYLNTIQIQVAELRKSFTTELQQDRLLMAHLHYVELSIHEAAQTSHPVRPLLATPSSGFERLESMWRSLTAMKSWFDIFFTYSPSECVGLSIFFLTQFSRCLMTLYRLSTYIDPAWDLNLVRNTLGLLQVLDHTAEKVQQTGREAGERCKDDFYTSIARMMRGFREWAGTKMASGNTEGGGQGSYTTAPAGTAESMPDPNDVLFEFMDFESDMLLENIFDWS